MVLLEHSVSLHNKSNNNNKILRLFFSKEIETLYQHYCLINLTSSRNSSALRGRRGQADLPFTYPETVWVMSEWARACAGSSRHTTLSRPPTPRRLSPHLLSLPCSSNPPSLPLLFYSSWAFFFFFGVFFNWSLIKKKSSKFTITIQLSCVGIRVQILPHSNLQRAG